MILNEIEAEVKSVGLVLRGGFAVQEGDEYLGSFLSGTAGTLILLGNAGDSYWSEFSGSPEYLDAQSDPLDRWSRRVIGKLSSDLRAKAIFPFDGPPYFPFQQWAARAEPLSQSPLGLYISPEYGLWHAFRGALLFDQEIDLNPQDDSASPCLSCVEQPCLNSCPVDAFSAEDYDAKVCYSHISSDPEKACVSSGCQARLACPVGKNYVYGQGQMRFLMKAFEIARRAASENEKV